MKMTFKVEKRSGRRCSPRAAAAGTLVLCLALFGCGPSVDPADVVARYSEMVHLNYQDNVTTAQELDQAIQIFVTTPTETNLTSAKAAWLKARDAYGLSEGYRFYGGPIDDADGPEGRINAWPLDEAFIDYVEGNPNAGMINQISDFPTITEDLLLSQNEKGGEKNIATGYHAVEFLLWGQDSDPAGPGDRPSSDYLTGEAGTAANADRRALYLTTVSQILVDDLTSVAVEWEPNKTNYRSSFNSNPAEAIGKILKGMGSLAGAELSRERMNNAVQEQDQEEEHSCFSDNTLADLRANMASVSNVYFGSYKDTTGLGLSDLVRAKNPDLDARLQSDLDEATAAISAIPAPFDQAILSEEGRSKIQAAIAALEKVTAGIVDVAAELEVTINLEE